MREIYANLALHAFIAKTRPKELSNLTTLPAAQRRIAAFNLMMRLNGYTSLDDFDRHYPAGNPLVERAENAESGVVVRIADGDARVHDTAAGGIRRQNPEPVVEGLRPMCRSGLNSPAA
jgi:hypothetical protein